MIPVLVSEAAVHHNSASSSAAIDVIKICHFCLHRQVLALEDVALLCTVVSNTPMAYRYDNPASSAAANKIVAFILALEEPELICTVDSDTGV
jgi:hypothetical protein